MFNPALYYSKTSAKKLTGKGASNLKLAALSEIIYKKVKQIINSDEFTIEHYKNLRHGQSGTKRAHIDKSFVLTFNYDKERKFVLFLDFDHHDRIYKR